MGKHGPMLLGGHRGMGENLAMLSTDGTLGVYPAYRENTIQSFQEAVKCGVGFVEFDVQVTRDNVPVIWHDDDVVIGTADHPRRPMVKDLTYAELQSLCGRRRNAASPLSNPVIADPNGLAPKGAAPVAAQPTASESAVQPCGGSGSEEGSDTEAGCGGSGSPLRVHRGGSEDGSSEASGAGSEAAGGLLRRFRDRATRQWTNRYAPWRCSRDDSIPTLEAVFASLPPQVGFDIEIKMTTGDDVVHTPVEEVDRMLAAILPVVHRCASPPPPTLPTDTPAPALPSSPSPAAPTAPFDFIPHEGGEEQQHPQHGPGQPQPRRRIMFSSFDPDVCVELKRRQASHPVYYLSGCGLYEHADARRTSIPAALAFAEAAGMRGVVLPASVLLKNMDMVASASSRQLELMTYGLENNDLDCLRRQADAGVAAAIVDEVAGVTAALGAGGEAEAKAEAGKGAEARKREVEAKEEAEAKED